MPKNSRLFRFLVLATLACSSLNSLRAERQVIDLSGPGWQLWRDQAAAWQADVLFPPGTDLAKIPPHAPTGGWDRLTTQDAVAVAVPGTVEQYLYHRFPIAQADKHSGGLLGVSWWYRPISIPRDLSHQIVRLDFESTRFRTEVYLDQKLVGYNLVEGVPFRVDLTGLVKPGGTAQLAVRITNPGGLWSWEDFGTITWGKYKLPQSRGFSGITGGVKLSVLEAAHLEDVYVQNTPNPHEVNVQVTVQNSGKETLSGMIHLEVKEKSGSAPALVEQDLKNISLPAGESSQTLKLSAPAAKLWNLEHPNLYTCTARLTTSTGASDTQEQTFGFRWFTPEGLGSNALFRLNGQRIVLRTAISWGLWPTSGLVPTPELAQRQVSLAKTMGLNMLNFHRAIGQTSVLDQADAQGLLYFEEPGSYVSATANDFDHALQREKLLRMVKRDRSHPSLVIYNMINEQWNSFHADQDPKLYAIFKSDMAEAHRLDPSRVLVLASAWTRQPAGQDEKVKLNMLPFSETQNLHGWSDFHRAGGPDSWNESFYRDPQHHHGFTANAPEIVYWGEEGAMSSPPRLQWIKAEVEKLPAPGWDGALYLDWYRKFDDFLTRKNLRASFPTVDDFCLALGKNSIEHQGKKIEDTRICDLNDGYAINGWEAEPYENHSGIVDSFRFPKGDPAILAYYNQPLYLAIKTRNQVVPAGAPLTVDYYLINEKNLHGPCQLKISAETPEGTTASTQDFAVSALGGDTYGQLLREAVTIPTTADGGLWTLQAAWSDATGKTVAQGHEQVLVVNWKETKLGGRGAVYENGSVAHDFLKKEMGLDVPAYRADLPPLDWILVARATYDEPVLVPTQNLQVSADGKPGLQATFFSGEKKLGERVDPVLDASWNQGESPDPSVAAGTAVTIRWTGRLLPTVTGNYHFSLGSEMRSASLKIQGQEVLEDPVPLTAQTPVDLVIEYKPGSGKGQISLLWAPPSEKAENAQALLQRAKKEGTCILLIHQTVSWMGPLQAETGVNYAGAFKVGRTWLGGQLFVGAHPLFKDLPLSQVLDWPYQAILGHRTGLRLEGEELVAGCWQSFPIDLGTTVGIVPCGKGKIVVSTLDVYPHLKDGPGPAEVARKLLVNFIAYAQSTL